MERTYKCSIISFVNIDTDVKKSDINPAFISRKFAIRENNTYINKNKYEIRRIRDQRKRRQAATHKSFTQSLFFPNTLSAVGVPADPQSQKRHLTLSHSKVVREAPRLVSSLSSNLEAPSAGLE